MTVSQLEMAGVTRGYGLLEEFLASQRAVMADKLIPPNARCGRLLDIGCGCEPYFLTRTEFAKKNGVDKIVNRGSGAVRRQDPGFRLSHFDVDQSDRLPFDNNTFDVVTMLAVFEHIRQYRLSTLLNDIDRILKPGGVYIMTTPAGWTGPILAALKYLCIVSAVEIDEHQAAYTRRAIRSILGMTKLGEHPIRFGSFECMMNTWAVARKPGSLRGARRLRKDGI